MTERQRIQRVAVQEYYGGTLALDAVGNSSSVDEHRMQFAKRAEILRDGHSQPPSGDPPPGGPPLFVGQREHQREQVYKAAVGL